MDPFFSNWVLPWQLTAESFKEDVHHGSSSNVLIKLFLEPASQLTSEFTPVLYRRLALACSCQVGPVKKKIFMGRLSNCSTRHTGKS